MLTTGLVALALLIGLGLWIDRKADLNEARTEARFPPQGSFVTVGGRDVHVVVKGEGPDLVLIHGAGGNARDFTFRFMDRLTDRYRVFAVDRPGLGFSDPLQPIGAFGGRAATPREQARQLADAVVQLGAERPLVLGHSYGAAVAMAWALEREVSGLVIVSGATMPWPGPLRLYYRIFGSPLGGAIGAPLVSAFWGPDRLDGSVAGVFAPRPMPRGYVQGAGVALATRSGHFRASARQVRALRPELVEQSEDYALISVPVELIHGVEDDTVWADVHAVPLSRILPDANLTLLDGEGHAPHHTAPEAVVEAIDSVAARAGLR